eukprot:TRINITY_DN28389_c0_g1_i1.p1 TRINITY_DN28389_c0_g1~~TRINITY_DN28389_c0_g1_i1.p1  ORF type:complete len:244 (+),score=40.44 TRINITY_DN28389_c0_g1_i1:37-768(+)
MADISMLETMASRMSVGSRRRRGACTVSDLESGIGGIRIAGVSNSGRKRGPPPFLDTLMMLNKYSPYLPRRPDGNTVHVEDTESQERIQTYLLKPVELRSQNGTVTRGVLAAVTKVSRRSSRGHGLDSRMGLTIRDRVPSCHYSDTQIPQRALRLTHCETFNVNGEPTPSCQSRIFYIEDVNTLRLIEPDSDPRIPPTPLTTYTFPPTSEETTSSIEVLDDDDAPAPQKDVDILSLILKTTHV